MPIPQIPIYTGDVPQRTQAPEVFSVNADAWLAYQAPLAASYNQVADYLNQYNYADRGFFTPTTQQEYPDTSGVDVNQYFGVVFPSTTDDYTFTSGDLSGVTVTNGATLRYADGSWTYALPYGGGVSQASFDSYKDEANSKFIQWDLMVGFRFRDSLYGFDRTAIALKGDGTEVLRADFPKLWSVASGIAVSQSLIDADPETYAASYGDGDGVTTFTLPNYGLMPWDAAAGIYGAAGTTVGDAIRNITGQLGNMVGIFQGATLEFQVASGVFERTSYTRNIANKIGASEGDYTTGNNVSHLVNFDSSNVVPTADVNRPKSNFSEIWIIHGEIA